MYVTTAFHALLIDALGTLADTDLIRICWASPVVIATQIAVVFKINALHRLVMFRHTPAPRRSLWVVRVVVTLILIHLAQPNAMMVSRQQWIHVRISSAYPLRIQPIVMLNQGLLEPTIVSWTQTPALT